MDRQKLIDFYEAVVYTESKTRFSVNSNFPNRPVQTFQQLELKFRVFLSEQLDFDGLFKTAYSLFNSARDERPFFINAIAVNYHNELNMGLKLGSLYLNYSPYLLVNYPWEKDIFRGLEFSFKYSAIDFQTFLANNGVDPVEAELYDAAPSMDKNMDRTYSTINLGYTSPVQENQRPTWWYGSKLKFNSSDNFIIPFSITGIFLNEELQYTAPLFLFSQVYQNRYAFGSLNFNVLDYIRPDVLYSVCFTRVDFYSVQTNVYGLGKNVFTKTARTNFQPRAVEVGFEIPSLLGNLVGVYRTSVNVVYDQLDERYTPVYLDSKYQIRRSFDPEINIYSGHEGVLGIVRQYFLNKTSIGYGYKQHKFKFNEMVPFLKDGTLIEHQIRLEEQYFNFFKVKLIFQIQEAQKASFDGGVKKMNAGYVKVWGDIIDNLALEIEYANNLDYYKGFDQLAVKVIIWGF